jgi:hypothetical protein
MFRYRENAGLSEAQPEGDPAMSALLGAVTLASTVCGLMLGQITAGAQSAGVVIAALVLMTLRA